MQSIMRTVWGFPEELQPAGEPGSISLLAEYPRNQQAERLRAVRVETRPWFIIIWEKLTDGNVPGPDRTRPYCCYIRTVFFYKQPYQVDEGKQAYQHWAQVESTLRCDDVVEFEGERFEVGTGMIVWYEGIGGVGSGHGGCSKIFSITSERVKISIKTFQSIKWQRKR